MTACPHPEHIVTPDGAHASTGPVLLVFNRQSGRRDGAGPHALRDAVAEHCRQAGRRLVALEARRPSDLPSLAQRATAQAQSDGGVVVAAGGDGTINLVAHHALAAGVTMGVLPQGTFNYVSRTHGIPAEVDAAMAVVLHGRRRAVQVGLVNDQLFLVNASLGLYVSLIADRERAKARLGRSQWVALLAAVDTLWRGGRVWALELATEQGATRLQATTVFVGNSALQLDQVGVPEASAVAQGALAGVALLPMSRLAMVGLALRSAVGRLAQAEAVRTFAFTDMVLSPARLRSGQLARVAVDGEIRRLTFPLHFGISPQPLWLMTPPDEAAPA